MQEGTFQRKQLDRWSYYSLPGLTDAGIRHGFFTKNSPDTRNSADMAAFSAALGDGDTIVMDQEHGDDVHVIAHGERPIRGDAMIVTEKNVIAVVKTADCLPVIIADPTVPMAAVIHAGWRGTVKKIAAKAARMMVDLGARGDSMTAMLGPSIGPCCYEVGDEVVEAFREEGFSEKVFREKGPSAHLDLRQANRELLLGCGITSISDMNLCTFCTGDLFVSYRRGERDARQISFVSLKR